MGKNKIIQNWQTKKLGEVCEIRSGKNQKNVVNPNGKYPIYGSSGIFGYADDYISEANTTIIGRKGTINNPIYVTEKFWNVDTAFGLHSKEELNSKYLFYFCKSFNFHKLDKSTTIPSLSKTVLHSIDVPVPPLETQHAIVSKIEELFSELDKGIAELKTAQQQLKTYRQSVLKSAFEGKLTNENVKDGELPEGWEIYKIKDVCDNVKVGIVIKPTTFYSKDNSGIKAFRSANVREFQVNDSNWVYFTEESNEINFRTKLKEGDVLLVRSGYPGTSCVVPKKYDGSNAIDILIATPNKGKILSDYLCCFNNSPLGKGMFTANSRGVAQKHLNVGEYSKLKINVPSLKEQHSIVQEIESRLSVADKMEQSIQESLQKAEALRQSILKKAFNGELV